MSDDSSPPEDPRLLRLRADAVDWREVESEVVVLEHDGSTYLAVNESGAVLWPALARGATVAELVESLRERFDVDAGQARADVNAFIASLDERGLLER